MLHTLYLFTLRTFMSFSIAQSYLHLALFAFLLLTVNTAHSYEANTPVAKLENTLIITSLSMEKDVEESLAIATDIIAKADTLYRQKDYSKAIKKYKEATQHLSVATESTQTILGTTYTKIAQSYKRIRDRENTAHFYRKALEVYTELGNKKYMARTLNTLAEAERYLENYIVALNTSNKSLALHKEIDDPEGEAKALMGAGIIHRHIGLYEESFNYVYQAYQYHKKTHNYSGIAKTANEMGLIYTRLKSYDQARFFYQQTIELPEDQIEPKTLATAAREIAVIALDDEDYEAAEKMAKKAYQIYHAENDKSKASIVSRVLANTYREQGDKPNAITYYEESLSLAYEVGDKSYQVKTLIPLAKELIGIDTEKSIRLLKEALALAIEKNMKFHQLYSYNSLRKAEKFLGNYLNALEYAEQEILIAEQLQKEKDDNQLVLMKAKLHSKKIEAELDLLKESQKIDQLQIEKSRADLRVIERESEISHLKLEKNRYANLILAGLLILCFGVSVYIYRRFIASNKQNKELSYLAARDPLTNCYNRRVLFDLINKNFEANIPIDEYCIILMDVDHFKLVNDTYGHSMGDTVLRSVANTLQNNIGMNGIVSRFGGEEFCIILPSCSQQKAMEVAENIRQKVANEDVGEISITCSLGVTSIAFQAQTATELIEQADLALFKSKSLGRNQVTLWDKSLKE